jgi:hypothetical protein
MDRSEIEIALCRARATLLEWYASIPIEDVERGITPSEHDPATRWNALDHLAHLAGIERGFNVMIRRGLTGNSDPVGLLTERDGTTRTREQIMARVHATTEAWVREHRGKSLSETVALGQEIRAETLALLASLTDAQLLQPLPGAPWADGTIGGVLATNAAHARMHTKWALEGFAAAGIAVPAAT